MTDTDVREFLERMAAEPVIAPIEAAPLVRRAHHRLTRNAIGGAIGIALAIGVAFGGATLLRSEPAVPAEPPSLTPQPIPPLLHNGPVAFVGFLDGVVEVDLDTGRQDRLVGCKAAGGGCTETDAASWSSDGTRLAYAAQCGGGCGSAGDPFHGIRVLDATTGTDELILPGEGFAAVDWSPDGTRLAYSTRTRFDGSTFTPDRRVQILSLDGSGSTVLPGAEGAESISWSPDGTEILTSTSAGMMWAFAADGSSKTSLGPGRDPEWSPDGTRIAYAHFGPRCEIWTMAPDGSDRVMVASLDLPRTGTCNQGPSYQAGPVWSPDGRRLAYLQHRALWILDADGGDLHAVHLHDLPFAWGIAWRPIP